MNYLVHLAALYTPVVTKNVFNMIKQHVGIALCLILVGCNQPAPPQYKTEASQETQQPQPQQSSGMMEHMAGAAVAGAAAGSAGAVAHNMTNRAMHHASKRRAVRRRR